MHDRTILSLAAAFLAAATIRADLFTDLPPEPQNDGFGELKFSGGNLTANRKTGETVATGNIKATSGVYSFFTDKFTRSPDGVYDLGENAMFTTCTNSLDDLHWKITGHIVYDTDTSVTGSDLWLYMKDIPVFWLPWFYYPMNTEYGFRFLPGYTKRWGAYFLSGYVYDIHEEHGSSPFGLGGTSYFNLRSENGVEIGQTLRWRIGETGKGKIKGFYAWDEDYDRYTRHWRDSSKYNYANWGSEVDKERYRILLEHRSDFTERDTLNVHAQYLSDSHYLHDFFRKEDRQESIPANEAWYEHRENTWAAGVNVSGPVNGFYGGVARLPEAWVAIEPQPISSLPVNYESQTRSGYLNRQYAKYGSKDPMFRYDPYIGSTGRGADYRAFRADSTHRITAPFMVNDIFSIVPRAGYRATWWSDSGDAGSAWNSAADEAMYRGIAEIGATFSARAHTWMECGWQHIFEPYLDYSFQDAHYGSEDKNRHYVFDNYDGSVDWLDQFGFEGRGLPYSWHGVRPGIRNYLRKREENGMTREFLATDLYAAIPFMDEAYRGRDDALLAGHPEEQDKGFYNRRECVVPGFMMRFTPSNKFSFTSRTEYDIDAEKVAYADLNMEYRVSHDFKWQAGYIGRDHRIWDYLPSEFDRWNYQYSGIVRFGFEHTVCDWFAWSPFIRWDARCNELDETGAWFDFLTDCLGFRFALNYENGIHRVDGSKHGSDFEVAFAIYLRTLGASSMLDLAKF